MESISNIQRKGKIYKDRTNARTENILPKSSNLLPNRKDHLRLACINVRGWTVGKLEDISKECSDWGIDFLGITETQLRERLAENNEEYTMINKGRSKWMKKGGGIGFLYKNNKVKILEEIDVGCDLKQEDILAILIEFSNGKKLDKILIILCYMTVEGPDARVDNIKKYESIERVMKLYPKEKTIIMGDMNAHIGILGEKINCNGKKLIEFSEKENLEILNTTIAKGKVTWASGNNKSAIDYVLCNEKGRDIIDSMWIDG